MKKRTLVCFLIFTLCVFHSSIPDTVFGQDDTSLVQQVYDKYSETLLREDLKDLVDQVLTALSDPATLKNPTIVALGGLGPALDLVLGNPALIRTVVPTVTDEQIGLLTNDKDIRAILMDPNVRTLLQNTEAVKELQGRLAAAPPIDPTPVDPAPPTISITTPSPATDQSGSFNVAFTTADVNGDTVTVTGSISVVPAEATNYYRIPSGMLTSPVRIRQTAPTTAMPTIPGATITLTLIAKDGTVAEDGTERSASATIVVTFAAAEQPPVDPGPPDPPDPVPPPDLTPSNLNGQSRLGGLSLNRVSGRAFIREIVKATGLPASSADPLVEPVVDFILAQIPQGILPKKAIRQILASEQPVSVFAEGKKSQLDFENFGNAITPSLVISDFADVFTGDFEVKKYLTSDNLNVYVRVPDVLEGGNVKFNLNGRTVEAERITPVEFQQDTIPYTFRLDESLAATNLPAWPGSDTQIFSSVVLRYSQTGLNGDYIAVTMNPKGNGVWESDEIGILAKGNTFYYFEVTLTHPVKLEVINPEALLQIAAAGTSTVPAVKEYIIENWSMPDPRNLQLAQRGIIDALFTPDLQAALFALLASPEVRPLIEAAYAGQPIGAAAIANAIPRKEITKLQNMFFRNVFRLTSPFEGKPDENGVYRGGNFDPLLASVFSVPEVDIETDSFWFANIGSIADGASNLQAGVYNANDELVDQIMVDFEVDTTAPAADIVFGDGVANFGENVTGYRNKEDIYVATAPNTGAAYLNITSSSSDVGEGKGYLIYQIIALDANGKPDPADTWLPLTVKNSMVASDIWKIVRGQLEGQSDPTLQAAATLELDDVLPLLNAQLVQQFANPFLKPFGIKLTEEQSALLANLIGAAVQDLNLIPLTYDTSRVMMMPVQGKNLDLLTGNFGIRAMGIDTLFNVGSYVAPTPLRVVLPEWDRTSVTAASLGDLNGDGDADEPYESGTIFRNATDVTLTVTVKERTVHPGTIMVEYEDADGNWQNIGKVDLAEGEHAAGTTFEVPWSVTDFDALVAAGDTVAVRTVTTNGLQLTDISTDRADKFIINLDADVHPVDPKVLVVDVITGDMNPDSGAPQGDITLTGYAARRTFPETESISVQVSMDSETWIDVGTVEVMTDPEHGIDGAETALKMFKGNTLAAVYDADVLHIDETSSYIQWSLDIDTVASGLEDSITKENLDAAHAASNKAGMTYVDLDGNRYMVRAYPVTSNGPDENGVAEGDMFTEKFSLDNVDDVGPLGPTNIVATMTDAYEDTGVFIDHGDGTYTVGGLVDKYADDVKSPVVTFTISPTADPMTYAGVKLMTSLPKGAIVKDAKGELILPAEDTGAYVLEGSGPITVTVDVGTLMDEDELVHNDRYIEDVYIENPDEFIYNPKGQVFTFQVHAIAYDAAMNYQTHDRAESGEIIDTVDNKITVNVQNTYRPDPGVIAISVVNSDGMVNPDSGAPQGMLTFDVYTYGITSAPTEGIRVEVRRKSTASGEWIDPTWERITGTAMPSEIVSVSEVPVTDLSDILTDAANAGIINTGVIGVLVGISEAEGESPASLMKWSYEVDTRKLALEDTDAPEGTIKLDDTINRGDGDSERDVSKDENRYVVRAYSLTPKNPVQVEYPKRDEYLERGGVEAYFSLDNDDDVPPLGPTYITDVADVAGSITANEDGSYTVNLIADDPTLSTDVTFTIEPTAEKITYAGGKIGLVQTVADGSETMAEASVEDGKITIDTRPLDNGTYMYHALVADKFGNWQVQGELDKPSPVITVHVLNFRRSDITDLTVTDVDGESPDRHVLQETIGELQGRFPLKESIAVSFNVNNGSLAVEDLTGILVDGHEVTFTAGSGAENAFSLMADKLSTLVDGWYTPEGRVTKRNGSVTFSLATINLDNTGPMIAVETPIEGHTVNDLPTLLAGFGDGDLGSGVSDGSGVSAADTAVVSLARLRPEEVVQDAVPIDVDQSMVEQDLDSVVYTRTDKLAAGAYQFTVQVADRLGNVGEQTVTFAIEGINPIVVITAPASGQTLDHSTEEITGFFTGGGEVNITKFTINDEPVEPEKSDNEFTYTLPEKDADADGALDDGEYTVAVEVTDGSGLTAKTSLTFTVELPVPAVAIHSPHAGQVYDNGKPIIAGDFTGAEPITVVLSVDGVAVEAVVNDNNQFTYTPADALGDGPHMVTVVVTDANGRTTETSTDFTVNIPGPAVMIHVPDAGQMYDISNPTIKGEYSGDAAAMPVKLSLMLNGEPIEAAESGNEFMYTLPAKDADADGALEDGEYTLVAVVTDDNGKTAEATAIFSVRLPVPTATIESPHAAQVYDDGKPIVAGSFSGAAPIAVELSIDGVAVEAEANDNNQFTYTPAGALSDGAHTVAVKVTDANGRTAETATDFTVDIPGPTVAILSPAAGQEYDHGMPVVRGEFGGETDIEFTLALDGETVEAMVEDNKFTYTPDPSLDDGEYILVAVATDANGKTAEATTIFSIRLPVPTVAVISPEAGQVYDHGKPVITGEFSGAAPIEVSLSIDGTAVEAEVNDNNQFTYTPADALSDGDHMIAVKVTDANGRMAETSSVFTVDIPGPSVAIHAPAAGQMYDISKPAVTGEFSGVAMPVELSLTLNGAAVVAEVSDNEFMYTPADALDDGEYTLVAVATDANGKTAEATAIFSIRLPVPTVAVISPEAGQVYDHGKPVITGEFSGAAPIEVSLSIDGTAVEAEVNDNNQFTYTPADALSDGDHMIAVKVTDANGRMAETSSVFTVDIPGPSVAIHAPAAGQMYDISKPAVTGEFSGVAMPVELSLTLNGAAVVAEVSDNEFMYTPADALDDGEYTLVAVATDANGKTAEATAIFSIRLPVPTVAVISPEAGQVYDHGKPVITGEFSGAAPIEVSLSIDGTAVEAEVNDNNQFTYTPADALSDGDHMIAVKVTDANGRMAETSSVFTVDIPGPSVAIHAPAAGQMYDISKPAVTGEFSGVAMPVELSLTLNGAAVVAEVSDNEFMYTPADALDDGEYTLVAVATDANGKTAEATAIFSIRLPVPTVAVISPEAGQVYDHGKPVITGEFSGAAPIEVSLSIDGTAVEAEVNDNNQFTYTPADALSDGDHMIAVKVTDANGRMAETSSVFTVDIPGPSVAIHSPASGQTYDHGKPVVRVEFSGMTDVEVTTFTVNGEDVAVEAEDNQFAYTPADALGTGEYVVFVEVTDANEKTAQATVVFNVKLDSTPPVISEVSPAGVVKLNKADILAENMAITISAVVLEEQSSISNMQYVINNGIPRSYPVQRATNKFEITESFTPGTHTIKLIAASEGGTREFEWRFTLEVDEAAPVISSITPAGTIHAGLPIISASATDESGVENIAIVVMDSNGEEVKGETQNDDEDRTNTGITRLDFHPEAPLSEGTYAIEVRATDAFGNSSTAKGGFTIDFDTAAPIITSSSPHNGARLMYKHDEMARPLLSITFGDGETGVNPDSIRLVIESPKAGGGSQAQPINLTDEQMSATQVLYAPAAPAFPNGFAVPGQYTVTLEVSDNAHQEGNVSEENDGARKANMAVYQFSFFVEFADAPILMKPFNFPNPFKDNTRISFGLNRMSTVSIVIYDVTGRPVRTLRDNVIMNAGNYTGQNGIGWDGKTSGGEDLARGIYYCVIEVTDGFEPESATLKLALTR